MPHYQRRSAHPSVVRQRSEEHTSELQSLRQLVCRLLLEKKIFLDDRHHVLLLSIAQIEISGGTPKDQGIEIHEIVGIAAESLFCTQFASAPQARFTQAAL